jgi:hypothetical protein
MTEENFLKELLQTLEEQVESIEGAGLKLDRPASIHALDSTLYVMINVLKTMRQGLRNRALVPLPRRLASAELSKVLSARAVISEGSVALATHVPTSPPDLCPPFAIRAIEAHTRTGREDTRKILGLFLENLTKEAMQQK